MLVLLFSIFCEATEQLVRVNVKKYPFVRSVKKIVFNEDIQYVGVCDSLKHMKKSTVKKLRKKRKRFSKLAKKLRLRRVKRIDIGYSDSRKVRVIRGKVDKPLNKKKYKFIFTLHRKGSHFFIVVYRYNKKDNTNSVVKLWKIKRTKKN